MQENSTSRAPRKAEQRRFGVVTDLGLSSRAMNSLLRYGISTVATLITWSPEDLLFCVRGLGWGGIEEIERALVRQGLSLTPGRRSSYTAPPTPQTVRNHQMWQLPPPKEIEASGEVEPELPYHGRHLM
ncbi:DNA-directed RNA polymerase subunit alpha C-terminal domain-containing protein [Paenarthrobacter sp. RAF9]